MQTARTGLLIALLVSAQVLASGSDIFSGAHRIIEVADDVYAVEPVFAGANGAFIVTDDGVVVVDTHGSPASAATLIDAIGTVTDKPVRYVVNTHWHVDHNSGNGAYFDRFGDDVTFIAHHTTREDIPTLGREQFSGMGPYKTMPLDDASRQLAEGMSGHGTPLTEAQRREITRFRDQQQSFIDAGDDFEFTLPDLTIEKSLVLHGGDDPVHVLFPGRAHTRGDLVVYIPSKKVVVAGDILTQPILWTWSGHPADYVVTLKTIEALDFDYILVGHGGPVLEGKEYLRAAREALDVMVSFAADAVRDSLEPEEAIAAAQKDPRIMALEPTFVQNRDQTGMFMQMVGWTIERAMQEAGSGMN